MRVFTGALMSYWLLVSLAKAQPLEKPETRVGCISILGNKITKDSVILGALGIQSGQLFTPADLLMAEQNLLKLNLFAVDARLGVRPTISIQDNPNNPDCEFKDLLVRVQETCTSAASLRFGINATGQPVVVWQYEERNFDPFGLPTCLEDFAEGRAFKGAGTKLSFEVQFSVVAMRFPKVAFTNRSIPIMKVHSWVSPDR